MELYEAVAMTYHAGQGYGLEPYSTHLRKVEAILVEYGYDDFKYRAAAWLHDTVEDTELTGGEIHLMFGDEVFQLVNAVTGVGQNRRERQANIMQKIAAYPDAAVVKLADRIANVEAGGKVEMYRCEQPEFERVVRPHVPSAMWERLEHALA